MEYAADWEHIAGRHILLILLDFDDLWGHKAGSAAAIKQIWSLLAVGSQTKVNNNGFICFYFVTVDLVSEHNVFRFQIAMHNIVLFHMFHSVEQSVHNILYFCQWKTTVFLFDDFKQILSFQQFQHNVNRIIRFVDCLKAKQIVAQMW